MIRGNVLVLTLSSVLWSISDTITWAYLSLYILSLGEDYVTNGIVNAISSISAIILYPLGGYIADKAGRARLIGFSILFYTSSYALFVLATTWQVVAIAMVYQQVVLFYMPAINALMADSIPVGSRGMMYALTVGLPEAVRFVTPYLGGWLIAVLTLQPAMRVGYSIGFALSWVVSFIGIRYLKETLNTTEPIGRDIPKILRESYNGDFESVRWMFKNIKGYVAVAIIIAFMGNFVMPFWIILRPEGEGAFPNEWGIILLLTGVTRAIGSFAIGGLIDRIGAKRHMIVGFALTIPSLIIFVNVLGFARSELSTSSSSSGARSRGSPLRYSWRTQS